MVRFSQHWYLNLETYRRNGQPIRTTMWFVEREGRLYLRTPITAGKVKRIRNRPNVRVAPCDRRGNLKGDWVAGQARLIDPTEAAWVNPLVRRKYGLLKRLLEVRAWLWNIEYVVIEVSISNDGTGSMQAQQV
jgi:PPOX class probable F420-dependent enzyme